MTDVREKLFESALAIFGRPRSCFSESVQNPNCVTSEEDLEEIYRQAEKFMILTARRPRNLLRGGIAALL